MNGDPILNESAFIDSNVWIYLLVARQDEHKRQTARNLIERKRFFVSTQVIGEVCVNLLRKKAMSEPEVRGSINSLYRNHSVMTITQETLLSASDLRASHFLSFWDSLIVASALQSGAQILYSEDMQHGLVVDGQLRIVNPFLQE